MADNILKRGLDWFFTPVKSETKTKKIKASSSMRMIGSYSMSYNGEKNLGELGHPIDYSLDYEILRIRSWQSFLESEIAQTVLKKYSAWIIGNGLKLKTDPNKQVLESEGIKINSESFNEITEMRFQVWAKSTMSSYDGMNNLTTLAQEAHKNSIVGGDVLVVLRLIDGVVKIQLIDGAHIKSPNYGSEQFAEVTANGNTIKNGIEQDSKGTHVAYWICQESFNFERVPVNADKSGLKMAFLVKGMTYRIDNNRGIPLIATVLETIKKLERYKEATVGSAEERQKIIYQVVHQNYSTGENPLNNQLAKAFNFDNNDDIPVTDDGVALATTVAASTNKQTFNMPKGSELKGLESKNELYFKDFYTPNVDIVCATLGIPPNVAMSLYNDSFSASRAATKDWEHMMKVGRENFSFQFYQNIYNFWLHVQILQFKIKATGYLQSYQTLNIMALESFRSGAWVGSMFPHIDPLKEVKAEREKLGKWAENIPLTTIESATEILNSGDGDNNIAQFAEELKYFQSKTKGLEPKNLSEKPIKVENVD